MFDSTFLSLYSELPLIWMWPTPTLKSLNVCFSQPRQSVPLIIFDNIYSKLLSYLHGLLKCGHSCNKATLKSPNVCFIIQIHPWNEATPIIRTLFLFSMVAGLERVHYMCDLRLNFLCDCGFCVAYNYVFSSLFPRKKRIISPPWYLSLNISWGTSSTSSNQNVLKCGAR